MSINQMGKGQNRQFTDEEIQMTKACEAQQLSKKKK